MADAVSVPTLPAGKHQCVRKLWWATKGLINVLKALRLNS